jgi:WS/DGAT/MGAT family acyltransferase
VKLHHALLDGGLGLEILAAVVDVGTSDDLHELSVPSMSAATKTPNPVDIALESVIDLVNGRIPAFLNLKKRFSEARNEPEGHLGAALGSLFAGTPCEISGALSDQREFRSVSFPLTVLSAHAKRINTTINNALLSIIAGAMTRYFQERGLDPIESLLALVPISLRGQSSENGEIRSSKNRLTGMLVSLPTTTQSPLERLEMTTKAVVESRAIVDSLGAEVLHELGSFVATPLISRAVDLASDLSLFDSIRPLFNLVVTNLSGVDFPLYLLGHRIDSIIPIGPLAEGSGLNITAYSYLDKMEVGLLSCPRLVQDPDLLVESIIAELDEVERNQVAV